MDENKTPADYKLRGEVLLSSICLNMLRYFVSTNSNLGNYRYGLGQVKLTVAEATKRIALQELLIDPTLDCVSIVNEAIQAFQLPSNDG